ncbi:MAG: ABC transporter substrate-binding protein [Phycisphaerales bacterium]
MRNLPRILVAVLFLTVLMLPLLWTPVTHPTPDFPAGTSRTSGGGGGGRLVIYSPHNEQIRYEVALAFSRWYEEKHHQSVTIDWRNVGGTSDIERILKSQFAALARTGDEDDGVGADLVFGGGDYSFDSVLKTGVNVPVLDERGRPILNDKDEPKLRNIPLTQPIHIDDALKAAAYPAPMIADKKLYDPDGHWWGVVLSSFGIVYNRDVLHTLNLPEPATWSDLTDPRYTGWIALADPSHSGSVKVTYEAILQRYGWRRGAQVLRRVFASARYFAPGSTQIPIDVSSGEAAAGMCIDYYARQQAESVTTARLDYVAPADATVITADPVAVLRGAPHRELAVEFIKFLLTETGQALWDLPVGDPIGPRKFALRRSPVRPDIYEKYADRLIDKTNPFTIAKPLPAGVPAYFSVIPTFLHSMCMDIHDDLRAAWVTINNTPDGELKTKMLEQFDTLPFTADELVAARKQWKLDPHAETADRLKWTAFFRDHYQKVIHMAR